MHGPSGETAGAVLAGVSSGVRVLGVCVWEGGGGAGILGRHQSVEAAVCNRAGLLGVGSRCACTQGCEWHGRLLCRCCVLHTHGACAPPLHILDWSVRAVGFGLTKCNAAGQDIYVCVFAVGGRVDAGKPGSGNRTCVCCSRRQGGEGVAWCSQQGRGEGMHQGLGVQSAGYACLTSQRCGRLPTTSSSSAGGVSRQLAVWALASAGTPGMFSDWLHMVTW
jgi:hypothetical protein